MVMNKMCENIFIIAFVMALIVFFIWLIRQPPSDFPPKDGLQ